MNKKAFQIVSLLSFLVSIGFLVTTVVTKEMIYSPIAAAFLCCGIVFLNLSKKEK